MQKYVKRTKEWNANISRALKRRKISLAWIEKIKNSYTYEKRVVAWEKRKKALTPERHKELSDKQKLKTVSQNELCRLRTMNIGRVLTNEHKEKIRIKLKAYWAKKKANKQFTLDLERLP